MAREATETALLNQISEKGQKIFSPSEICLPKIASFSLRVHGLGAVMLSRSCYYLELHFIIPLVRLGYFLLAAGPVCLLLPVSWSGDAFVSGGRAKLESHHVALPAAGLGWGALAGELPAWRAGHCWLLRGIKTFIYLFVSQVTVKMDYRVQLRPGWLYLAASLPAFHEWVPQLGGLGLVGSMPPPWDVEGAGCPGGSAAPHSLSGASQTSQCFYIGIQFTLACVSKDLEDCFS